LILVTSGIVLGFFLFVMFGAPTGILIAALVAAPTPQEWWIPWVMGTGLLALGALGILANTRVYVSAERVRRERPFDRQRTAYWREVASVTIRNDGCLTLVSKDGTRVAVTPDLVGVADFADMLEQHLPPEVWKDFEADFIGYRQFVT
jgi:hypothetical protein